MKISGARIFHNIVTLISITMLTVQPILAQNITSAPSGPQVLTSSSGIDMVMISGADANGVSHNVYTNFNVGEGGAILNNASTDFVMTDLAGWVQGNTNLSGGSASIIINEVTSANPSTLAGFLEVAGERADVIVANAYGITCNGCGFINTDRAVLTSGSTTFTNGAFTGFSVEQGNITIGENGANALDTTQFDLISRQVTVAGAIAGHRLRITTGRNDVTYVTGEVVEKADDGSTKPALAIDSTVLGGMYGDSITILSTEDGVGVRAPDNMAANAGEMILTADGRLVMRRASSVGNITATSSGDIVIESSVIASGNVTLTAAQNLALFENATIVSQSALTLDAEQNISFGAASTVLASTALDVSAAQNITLGDSASLVSYNTVDLLGQNLTALGQSTIVSGGQDGDGNSATANLGLTFQNRIDLSGALLASSGALTIESRILNIAAAGALPAAQFVSTLDMAISAEEITANEAVVYAKGNLDLGKAPQDLTLQGGTFSAEGAVGVSGQTVDLDTTILSRAGALDVSVNALTQAGYLGAATALDITSEGDATLDGTVLAGTALYVNAGGALDVGGLVQASTALDIIANDVRNSGTMLASEGDVTLTSLDRLDNSGTLYSAGTLKLNVANDITINGQIAAIGALDLQSSGALTVAGQLTSNDTITLAGLTGAAMRNLTLGTKGIIFSEAALDIATQSFNNAGVIASGSASTTLSTSTSLINTGTISAAQNLNLTTTADLENAGKILASGDITLTTTKTLLNNGIVEAAGNLTASAASLNNSQSMVSLGAALNLDITGDVTNTGTLQSAESLTLAMDGTLTNSGALLSFGTLTLIGQSAPALTALDNAASGIIMSSQAMNLAVANVNNAGNIGTLNGAITLANLTSFNNSGTLSAAGNLAIAPTGALLNTGTLLSGADLTLNATQDFTNAGTIQALNNVSLTGTNITNAAKIQALNGTLTLSASGNINNDGFLFGGLANHLLADGDVTNSATISAGGAVEVGGLTDTHAANLVNTATAKITSGFNVSLSADNLANHGAIGADNGIAALSATSSLIHDGTLSADVGIIVNADAGFSLDGDMLSNGWVQITSTGTIINNATLQAEGNFALTAASLINNDRIKSLTGGLDIASTGNVTNNATLFGSTTLQLRTDGALVLNSDDITSDGTMLLRGLTGEAMAAFTLASGQELLSTGDMTILADAITNAGAIASTTGNLTAIGVSGITNADTGIFYATDTLALHSDGAILNDGGVLLASQNMLIGGFQNPRATRFTNQHGGHVETFSGDISITAITIENLSDLPVFGTDVSIDTDITTSGYCPGIIGLFSYSCTTTTTTTTVTTDTAAQSGSVSQIISGGSIYMSGGDATNQYGLVSATDNIVLNLESFTNTGVDLNESTEVTRDYHKKKKVCLIFCLSTTNTYWSEVDPPVVASISSVFSTVEAGGAISGSISGYLSNGAVQAGLAPTVIAAPVPTLSPVTTGPTAAVPTGLALVPTAASALTGGIMQGVTPDGTNLPGTGSTPGVVSALDGSLVAGPSIGALNQPALFVTNDNPDADYLIETRFEFIDLDSFLSSDYFIDQINFDPSITQKRLGDAYVETDYIRQQLFELTGRRLLEPGISEYDQMKAMYDGAINAAQALDLRPGIALNPTQIAALTQDIIWLEEQIVRNQVVLVPRVYLAQATLNTNTDSAKMVASVVSLEVGTFTNYGSVAANDIFFDASTNILNVGGSIVANNTLTLMAGNTIRNTNGIITGADVYLSAQDIINETTASQVAFGDNLFDIVGIAASISAINDLTMIAGNDITITGANLVAGRNGVLQAGGDVTFAALELASETNSEWKTKGGLFGIGAGSGSNHTESVTYQVSTITTGGDLTIVSTGAAVGDTNTGNIIFEGTQVAAGGDMQITALQGNVILGAVADTSYTDSQSQSSGLFTSASSRIQTFDLTNQVTSLSGANIDVYAAGSIIAEGTSFNAGIPANRPVSESSGLPTGNLTLTAATGDIVLGGVTDVRANSRQSSREVLWGLIGSDSDVRTLATTTTGITANVAGDMTLNAGRDLTMTTADITAGGSFTTNVIGDTTLLAAIDTAYRSSNMMTNNGIIITDTGQSDLSQSATFNSIQAASVSFDTDSTVTFDANREAIIDSTHPAAWVGDANDRLAIAGAYLGWESASGGVDQVDGTDDATHWRSNDTWSDEQNLLIASLPTAADGAGFGYIENLLVRDSTVNNTIELLDVHFYEQQKELNPAFKALVSLAIGSVTGGLGLGTFGTEVLRSLATEVVAGALTGEFNLEQALGAAVFAGVSSIATEFVNAETLGITLGESANAALLGFGDDFTVAALVESGIDSTVTAGLSSAVYGTDFTAGFVQSFATSVVNLAMADFQTLIGDQELTEGGFEHAALHGLVGCAAAEATGTDCVAGAVGGIAQSIYAGTLESSDLTEKQMLTQAALIGGLAGYFVSGGEGENVTSASTTARSGLENNYLSHSKGEIQKFQKDIESCQSSDNISACEAAVYAWAQEKSDANNAAMAACGSDYQCLTSHHEDITAGDEIRAEIMENTAYMTFGTGGFKSLAHVEYSSLMLDAEYGDFVDFGNSHCNGAGSDNCQLYYAWDQGWLPLPPDKELSDVRNAFNNHAAMVNQLPLNADGTVDVSGLVNVDVGFIKVEEGQAILHNNGLGVSGNIKLIHPEFGFEVVYDIYGRRVTDAVNMGTFNFGENPLSYGHVVYDMDTYFAYGTGPNDPSTPFERAAGSQIISLAYDGPIDPSRPYYQPWMQPYSIGMLGGEETINTAELQEYLESFE